MQDFRNAVKDFYLTNPIARASQLMAELSAGAKARASETDCGRVIRIALISLIALAACDEQAADTVTRFSPDYQGVETSPLGRGSGAISM